LVELFESNRTEWTERVLTLAEARFERRLTHEISAFRAEVTRELGAIRQEFTRELATVRVELIRWSFVFWIGQVAVTIGILAFMLRGIVR
jgi:hypothetical protein